jgi:hypothetical protein
LIKQEFVCNASALKTVFNHVFCQIVRAPLAHTMPIPSTMIVSRVAAVAVQLVRQANFTAIPVKLLFLHEQVHCVYVNLFTTMTAFLLNAEVIL